ncbi:hypothetical protein ACNKHW_14265 [Shigella flexneri]
MYQLPEAAVVPVAVHYQHITAGTDQRITAILPVREYGEELVFMATASGTV